MVRSVAAFHTKGLYHVLRIVFLTDDDGPFLTIAGDAHAVDLRKSLRDESTLIVAVHLNFPHPSGANNFVSLKDGRNQYQVKDAVLLQSLDLLVR